MPPRQGLRAAAPSARLLCFRCSGQSGAAAASRSCPCGDGGSRGLGRRPSAPLSCAWLPCSGSSRPLSPLCLHGPGGPSQGVPSAVCVPGTLVATSGHKPRVTAASPQREVAARSRGWGQPGPTAGSDPRVFLFRLTCPSHREPPNQLRSSSAGCPLSAPKPHSRVA